MAKTVYKGQLPTTKLVKTTKEVKADAVKWAVWIAGDNRFHYGYTNKTKTINAHHNGCYFCGTNTNKGKRSKKGIVDYKRTYCCNPFVTAAWAHGGCVPTALQLCQKGQSWGFSKGTGYDKSSLFKNLGHPAKSELKSGDVLCSNTHVALYIGDGKLVEAAGGDDNVKNSEKWNKSIRVTTLTDKRYQRFKRVHRFIGKVDTIMYIRHGEISNRVAQWQAFLDWWYDGKVGVADGIYGDNTFKWTAKFQEEQIGKGQGDGIVGPLTLEKAKKCVDSVKPKSKPTVEKTWVDNANAWAKKIAADNSYHYKKWKPGDVKTHKCPVCENYPKGPYHGWNCIGFAHAVWHHGGGLKNRCDCSVISNQVGEKMYNAKTADEALKIAQKRLGLKNITVIRNKKGIPKEKWKAGDICLLFSGSTYIHTFYYMGNGKVADSTGSSGKIPNDQQIGIRDYKKYSAKVIVRYNGK